MLTTYKSTEHSRYLNKLIDALFEGKEINSEFEDTLANEKLVEILKNTNGPINKSRVIEEFSMSNNNSSCVNQVDFLPINRLIEPNEVHEILSMLENVLPSGEYTSGKYVGLFEDNLKKYTQFSYCISVSSGTMGLMIALEAANIKAGDEVILPANSFAATENAVISIGAHPVWIDVDPYTYCLDASKLSSLITSKTKAVLAVDIYGDQPDYRKIQEVAHHYGIQIIEDGCQAIGSENLGFYSDLLVLSFNPYKNLGVCGKSGAILTNNEELALKCRELAYHGFAPGQKNIKSLSYGYNARMDNLQAAIGLVRFKYLTLNNMKRTILAKRYLQQLDQLQQNGQIILPVDSEYHVWHLFPIQIKEKSKGDIQEALKVKHNIQTEVYYPVLSHHQNISYLQNKEQKLINTEETHVDLLHLPLFPQLTIEEQDLVVEAIKYELE